MSALDASEANPGSAVFLDRDGVLNRAFAEGSVPRPPRSVADLEILPGVPEACAELRRHGLKLIVVTNQPDVARGTLALETLDGINEALRAALDLDEIVVCVHDDADGCGCRKPAPGMLVDAARRHHVALHRSVMVGDRWRDIEAGKAAGCQTVFIDHGYDERRPELPDAVATSLLDALPAILAMTGRDDAPLELAVVLPCLNEAETLATCVRKALGSMAELGIDGEVVVADNGSTDGSQGIARREGARVVDVAIPGYGAALMGGIEAARGRFVIMADADDSYDLSDLGPFVDALRGGADLVMGNRFKGGIAPGAMPRLHRYLGNPVLTFIGRLFFRSPSGDFHCGMRGFRRDAILGLGLRTTGMEFASEMVVKATLEQLAITEVPTTLSPDGRSRPPHLRTWRDGWRHLRFLLLYSPRWLFLYPGLLLLAVGSALGVALLPGPIQIGDHALDVTALVYAMGMVLIGFQAIMFGVFARAFAMNEGLLPVSKGLQRAFHIVTLERGLVIGVVMLLVGFAIAIYSLVNWGSNDFGALDTRDAIRVAVPAATLLVLGFETVMASFFLSVLGLARR